MYVGRPVAFQVLRRPNACCWWCHFLSCSLSNQLLVCSGTTFVVDPASRSEDSAKYKISPCVLCPRVVRAY